MNYFIPQYLVDNGLGKELISFYELHELVLLPCHSWFKDKQHSMRHEVHQKKIRRYQRFSFRRHEWFSFRGYKRFSKACTTIARYMFALALSSPKDQTKQIRRHQKHSSSHSKAASSGTCLCTSTAIPPHLSICIFRSAGTVERSHLHIDFARGWWHGWWLQCGEG